MTVNGPRVPKMDLGTDSLSLSHACRGSFLSARSAAIAAAESPVVYMCSVGSATSAFLSITMGICEVATLIPKMGPSCVNMRLKAAPVVKAESTSLGT